MRDQLGPNEHVAMAGFTTYGQDRVPLTEHCLVFRDRLLFDAAELSEQPAWGWSPTSSALTGPAVIFGEFLWSDQKDPDLVWVHVPTADPSAGRSRWSNQAAVEFEQSVILH